MGMTRAGFEVVGFDIKPQPRYPFEFHQADAMEVDLSGFDAVWASPPCQGYIQRNKNLVTRYLKLIEPTREMLDTSGLPYIIENVEGAPLLSPLLLCGTMFDLPLRRHRLFESPWLTQHDLPCNHWGTVAGGQFAGVYAFGGKGRRHGRGVRDPGNAPGPAWNEAMGIDWMTRTELTQAIPPAYSEFLGKALIDHWISGGSEFLDDRSIPGRISVPQQLLAYTGASGQNGLPNRGARVPGSEDHQPL